MRDNITKFNQYKETIEKLIVCEDKSIDEPYMMRAVIKGREKIEEILKEINLQEIKGISPCRTEMNIYVSRDYLYRLIKDKDLIHII